MRVGSKRTGAALFLCLAYHQQRGHASSRSIDSGYDINKGVFSPQGRLVQLDYVEGIVKRGNLCMGVECKDGVVLVTNKLVTTEAAKLVDGGGVRRIYRVDSHIGILPAGLPADGRILAQKAMEYCRSHRREYGEPMPGRVLADRLGEHIHAACVRWGSRAYPNELLVACWGGDEYDRISPSSRISSSSSSRNSSSSSESKAAIRETEETFDMLPTRTLDVRYPDEMRQKKGYRSRRMKVGDGDELVGGLHHERKIMDPAIERDAGFQLYVVDPSGTARRHRAASSGRGSARAREWLRLRSSPFSADLFYVGEGAGDCEDAEGGNEEQTEDRDERSKLGRRGHLLLSEMTCAEAARAMVEEVKRAKEDGKGEVGAGMGHGVESLPEIAWLSMAAEEEGKESKEGNRNPCCFVHYRSVEEFFEEIETKEAGKGDGIGSEDGENKC